LRLGEPVEQQEQQQQTPDGNPTNNNTPESALSDAPNPEQMMGTDNLP